MDTEGLGSPGASDLEVQRSGNICLSSSMESKPWLESMGMRAAANSEDASAFLLSRSQQREHTDCEGEICLLCNRDLLTERASTEPLHGWDVMKQLYPALP